MTKTFRWLAVFLLLVIPAAIFWRTVTFDFINWDDDKYVYNNPDIRAWHLENFRDWLTKPYVSLYVPLAMASYAADYALYGLHPEGYHFTNLVFHLFNVMLWYALLLKLQGDEIGAFLGAMLFAVHPVQVETVAWVSERKTLLMSFFLLMSMLFYIRARERPETSAKSKTVAAFLAVCALLSKITAVVAPLVFLAYHYFYFAGATSKPRSPRDRGKAYFFFGTLLAISLVIGLVTIGAYPVLAKFYARIDIPKFLSRQAAVWTTYLGMFWNPFSLKLQYFLNDYWEEVGSSKLLQAAGCLFLILLWLYGLVRRKRFAFGLSWYIFFLLPVAGFFPVPVNDRHLYLTIGGMILFLLNFFSKRRWPGYAVLGILTLVSLPLGYARVALWRNSDIYWQRALKESPGEYRALLHWTLYRMETKPVYEVWPWVKVLLREYPDKIAPYVSAVYFALSKDRVGQAWWVLRQMAEYHPDHPELYALRAVVNSWEARRHSEKIKKAQKALDWARKAAAKGSTNPQVYSLLGMEALKQEDFPAAVEFLSHAEELLPYEPALRFYSGLAYARVGQWEKAASVFEGMVREGLSFPGLYYQLGYAYFKAGDKEKARKAYRQSLETDPDIDEAYFHLGLLEFQEGHLSEARQLLESAVSRRPDSSLYRTTLQSLYEHAPFETAKVNNPLPHLPIPNLQEVAGISTSSPQPSQREGNNSNEAE